MYFDEQAKQWDDDIQKHERAAVFADEIIRFIKPNGKLNALEFGCGTGLLSFQLKNEFKSITLVDSSKGMIDVLKEKIEQQGIRNFIPLQYDLVENPNQLPKTDVIYTLMVLHHIHNVHQLFDVFHYQLNSGGYLCIADLVKEDGSFHANHPDFDGHNGFDKEGLSKIFEKCGFSVVLYKACFSIKKQSDKGIVEYPLFLIIGKKAE